MSKVLGLLVALALFGAMPAVAAAQGTQPSGGGTTSSGNTQTGTIDQDANAGDNGNAGNQACLIQQNAGRDANAACNQTQNFNTRTTNVNRGVSGVRTTGVGTTGVRTAGVSGVGGVQGVTLARTGFDAWVLALIGGVSLAGGLGLLAAQRRGRLSV